MNEQFWLQLIAILVAVLLGCIPILLYQAKGKKHKDSTFAALQTSVEVGHTKIFGKLDAIENTMVVNSNEHDDLFEFKQYSLKENLTKEDHDRLHHVA